MKLIVGLGNPGKDYLNTRHNVGFMVVDALESQIRNSKYEIQNKFKILKSTNFMNESGEFVNSLYTKYNIQNTNLYIVHDDLDIRLGEFKIQFGRGPHDHNGLKSVDEAIGTDQYWHVRVGVDNRPLDHRPIGEEYVLQDFSDDEKKILDRVIKNVTHELIIKLESQ